MHRFTRNDVKDALIFFRKHQTKTLQSVKKVLQKICIQSSLENLVSSHPYLKLRLRDCSHDKKIIKGTEIISLNISVSKSLKGLIFPKWANPFYCLQKHREIGPKLKL